MPTSISSTGTISWGCRFLPATIALTLLLVLGFAPCGFAQAAPVVNDGPLNFGNNFFVTGDYVVAGAYKMNSNTVNIGGVTYTTGTINVPDTNNTGLSGTNQVPTGAEVLKALLYWQTIENGGVLPGGQGSGQNGFFRPVFTGGPQTGYAISGVNTGNSVAWASSGCSPTGPIGKQQLTTYRAEVTNLLPQDANGNILPNSTYEVRLPSNGVFNHQPFTFGATLVIVYRVLSSNQPLNSIVFYDGNFAPAKTSQSVTQTVQGFYDAATKLADFPAGQIPFSRLTYILGNVQQATNEFVHLNGQTLPLLYGGQTAFPSHYVNWDTVTWTFDDPNNPLLAHFGNPVNEDDSSATTQIVPGPTNNGCSSLAAVVVSTTVKNSSQDGLLDSWKKNLGYCDASVNEGHCNGLGDPAWVSLADPNPLNNPKVGQQDVFVQYDYMCVFQGGACAAGTPLYCSVLSGTSCNTPVYSLDPSLAVDTTDSHKTAVQKLIDAYAANTGKTHHAPITLHVMKGNAIDVNDPTVTCTDNGMPQPVCSFPNQPGLVAWPGGLVFLKNQLIDYSNSGNAEACASNSPPATCAPRFQHGKKDSYHYVLFGQTLGLTNWALQDGSLAYENVPGALMCPAGTPCVVQKGTTVTFTTSTPNGIVPNLSDTVCPNGRVTVAYAITNPNLDGTFCITPGAGNSFSIQVANSTNAIYTYATDPNLSVAPGVSGTVSGFSYVGGGDSLITLGSWGPLGATWNAVGGTFMHELGHANGLTHGGLFFDKLTLNNPDYTPTFEANCKPNVQTVMSYLFQVDLLDNGQPSNVMDYSGQALGQLNETAPGAFSGSPLYPNTSWYSSPGSGTTAHCDGSPNSSNSKMVLNNDQPVGLLSWAGELDINFDGMPEASLRGYSEWTGTANVPGLDLRQVGATGNLTVAGGGKFPGGGSGGGKFPGGGSGGGKFPGGGSGGESELNVVSATAVPRDIRSLTATEANSARSITFNWISPTSGVVTQYRIYESLPGGGFDTNPLKTVAGIPGASPGTPYQTTVTVQCNTNGFSFKVTAVSLTGSPAEPQESSGLIVSTGQDGAPGILTGCYNITGPTLNVTSAVTQGTIVPISLTLHDDHNTPNAPVTNLAASTIIATGPLAGNCGTTGANTLLLKGVPQVPVGLSTFASDGLGGFTFSWDTDGFCAGSYTLTLTLDSGQTGPVSPSVQLNVDVNDTDTQQPTIVPTALPVGTVDSTYSGYALTSHGGVGTVTFSYSGNTLPLNMTSGGVFSGTPCTAGAFPFTVTATDQNRNTGSQGFTLQINPTSTTTTVMSGANPSVFQQALTFTVTVAPNSPCAPTGTVNLYADGAPIGSNTLTALSGGKTMFTFTPSTLSVGPHSITAKYLGDSNFNASNSATLVQTVNPANTTISSVSVSSPAFVGQAVSVAYMFGVQAPGGSAPTAPTGTITVADTSGDASSCVAPALIGPGACTLSPLPTTAGNRTLTVTYTPAAGDGNFVGSGANGNYNVYQLVFTTQPSNTGVGLTIAPAVVVTAEDSSNATLTSFTGRVTLTIGSGPGTLSGTTTQSAVAGVATFGDLSINKIANAYTLTASPGGGVPDATSNAFNIDTFYVDNQGNFGTLDLATGTVTQIGAATVPGATGLDLTPGLNVYTYNASNQLVQITPSSGSATPVGSTGSIPDQVTTGSLTDGSYFGIDAVTGNLYSINLTTGATTQVASTTVPQLPAGCGVETSLTGSANMLYYTVGFFAVAPTQANPNPPSCNGSMNDTLYQIDPASGKTTLIGTVTVSGSGVNEFVGSAFVGGTLYGFTSNGQEYTINLSTGAATFVVNTNTPIYGAGSSQ